MSSLSDFSNMLGQYYEEKRAEEEKRLAAMREAQKQEILNLRALPDRELVDFLMEWRFGSDPRINELYAEQRDHARQEILHRLGTR